MGLTFYILDVFAEEKYAGNQLAVVRGGADLSEEVLQKIALEMNYSETTFVLSDEETGGGYDVRIFTPGGEVPFAGHPTLGTAYVIRHEILAQPVDRIIHNLKAGKPLPEGESLARLTGYAAYIHMTDPKLGKKLLDELAGLPPGEPAT